MIDCGNKVCFAGNVQYAASDEETDDTLAQVSAQETLGNNLGIHIGTWDKSTKHKAHARLPGTRGPSDSSDWTNCSKVKMMRTVVPDHVTCMILTEMASLVVSEINLDRQREKESN
ncbi:unnamed protein product [Leuciscus chuanchicus]